MLTVAGAGGVSGGTVDSLLGFKDISSEERHAVSHPYCLNPPDKRCVWKNGMILLQHLQGIPGPGLPLLPHKPPDKRWGLGKSAI